MSDSCVFDGDAGNAAHCVLPNRVWNLPTGGLRGAAAGINRLPSATMGRSIAVSSDFHAGRPQV
jgi:hypothetical protein